MKLVIAEKPSVAKTIAEVVGAVKRENGYLCGENYMVSWCYGHLAQLAGAEVYDSKYAKWRYEDLPILPVCWQFCIGKDTNAQYQILKKLMQDKEVTEVINACDAGREGELIFRTVYELAECHKPMKRLWISSMEDTAIQRGMKELRDGADYNGLYQSALCRAKADWLVGINATRLFSVLYHQTLNVGRVMTPTLAMLVKREEEIATFQAETFYNVTLSFGEWAATGERIVDKSKADTLKKMCMQKKSAVVKTIEKQEKKEKPPALYDLTSLQREANRLFGFTAQQTLDYLQSLYEKKLCTYPRTDSRYLTSDMEDSIPKLVQDAEKLLSWIKEEKRSILTKQIINDQKVTDHHALLITKQAVNTDLASLSSGEQLILELLAARLIVAVGEAYVYEDTRIQLTCGDNLFTAKGRIIKAQGFGKLQELILSHFKDRAEQDRKESALPSVTEGMEVLIKEAEVKEGKTTAPKRYTEDTLLAAMETAGVKEMPKEAERKGLGTSATRAGILEKLVKTGFLERKKSKRTINLIPTERGLSLIKAVPEEVKSPMLTAEWEHQLLEIEKEKRTAEQFLNGIQAMVNDLVKKYTEANKKLSFLQAPQIEVGICPRCGRKVYERKQGFFCEERTCGFALWKNNKFFSSKKKELTKAIATRLLKDGKMKLTKCYSEKTGKTYDAWISLEDTGTYINFKLEFDSHK